MEQMPPMDRLLVLMSFSRLSESEREEAVSLCASGIDWQAFWDLADLNRITPLVQRNLERVGGFTCLPERVRALFEAKTQAIAAANTARLNTARLFLQRFADQGIPVVILKGVNFAENIYHDTCYKRMNDIDILIKYADLDAIYAIYAELGFFNAGELIGGKPRSQERFSHHAPSFISRDLTCMIGTHWGLVTPLSPHKYNYAAIWSRVRPFALCGIPVLGMAPEDNLHHLCVHLPYYKCGVRELADIYNLVRHHRAEFDWELFLKGVIQGHAQDPVYHALSLAHRLCPMPEFAECLRRLEPDCSRFTRTDTRCKIADSALVLRNRSTHIAVIEKDFTAVNTTKDAREKACFFARMWGNMLWAPEDEVVKMNYLHDPDGLTLLRARLLNPLRVFRLFIGDIGLPIFILLIIKLSLEVVFGLVKSLLVTPAEKRDYAAAFARLGVKVEDFERLKAGLE